MLLTTADVSAKEKQASAADYSFPLQLMKEKDYYRASTEFQRVYFTLGAGKDREFGILKSAECHYAANLPVESERLALQIAGNEYKMQALWLAAFAAGRQNSYQQSVTYLEKMNTVVAPYQKYLMQLHWALDEKSAYPPVPENLIHDFSEKEIPVYLTAPARPIADLPIVLKDWPAEAQKSQTWAAALSALVPASGYAYAGDWGDFLSGFLVTGFFAGTSVLAFNNAENVMGGVLAGGALIFYAGGIYGSAQAAEKTNVRRHQEYERRLRLFAFSYSWE